MRDRAKAMLRVARLLEGLSPEDCRLVAYDVYRTYGGPLTKAEAGRLGGVSSGEARRLLRTEADTVLPIEAEPLLPVEAGYPPPPVVATPGSSVSVSVRRSNGSKATALLLTQEHLDKAKALLSAGDFGFLQACPEPFRTAWLFEADWWVSLADGYPKIKLQEQASRYMSWAGTRRKRDHRAAFRNWVAKAERWREGDEMRRAVRR